MRLTEAGVELLRRFLLLLCLAAAVAGPAPAHAAEAEPPAMPVDEIRPGMRGYGETVFSGSTPERFDVEVLGVLRNVAPGTDYVLVRLSGHGLEHDGVVAGMSGSPVWIDGKLVGAVAFGWPFATAAVAGVTPIGAMRRIPESPAWSAPGKPVVSWADLAARRIPETLIEERASRLMGALGLDARPAVVWGAGGFSDDALAALSRALPALAPVSGGRSEAGAEALVGGSSIAALLIDGDLRLAATGTLTERVGDRILAFGHPLAGLGEVSIPLAPAEVVTILPSQFSSFKIANSGAVVGEFTRDQATGILGRLGVSPRTIPLEVTVAGPAPREFHLRLARAPDFVPLLAAIGTLGSIDSVAAAGGLRGVDVVLDADLGGNGHLELRQSFEGANAVNQTALWVLALCDFLEHNDLAEVDLAGLRIRATPWTVQRTAEVVGAHASRSRLEPGDRLEILVDLRDFRGGPSRRRLEVAIPDDLPSGRYTLLVGDGSSVDAARFAVAPAAPVTFDQALALLRSLASAQELDVLGVLPGTGIALAGEILPRLPPSLQSIWAAGGGGGARPLRLAVAQRERFPEPGPVSGLVRLTVEVRRPQPTAGDEPQADGGDAGEPGAKRSGTEHKEQR
jgi:SpoIVB peptidase S55